MEPLAPEGSRVSPAEGAGRARRRAALLALGVALYVAAGIAVHAVVNRRLRPDGDALVYLDAARRARAGGNPYEPFAIGTSFIYPPAALLFVLPFADLPPRVAPALWGAVGVAFYGGSVLLLAWRSRALAGGGPGRRLALLLLAAAYTPFLENVRIGQVNPLVLFGLVAFLVGLEAPRWRWVGDAGLAVAVLVKMSPAVLLALPLARGDLPRLGRVAVSLAALCLGSMLFLPAGLWSDFGAILPSLLGPYASLLNQAPGPTLMYVLRSAGLDPAWGALAGRVFTVSVLLTWLGVLAARRAAPAVPLALLGILTATLGSGLIWFHHLVYLVPALLLLPARSGRSRPAVTAAAAASLALIQSDRLLELGLGWPPAASIAGYLLIWVTTLVVAMEEPVAPTVPSA